MSNRRPPCLPAAVLLACAMTLGPGALAGTLSAGGASTAAAMSPRAVIVKVEEVGSSCSLPVFCDTFVSLMKRIVSASYVLVGSTSSPDPERIARDARMVYELLASSGLAKRG